MKFAVVFTEGAQRDLEAVIDYLRGQCVSEETIARWFDDLFGRIDQLEDWPGRFPVSPDASRVWGTALHRMNHGPYAVYFSVDNKRSFVYVLGIRHGHRDTLD